MFTGFFVFSSPGGPDGLIAPIKVILPACKILCDRLSQDEAHLVVLALNDKLDLFLACPFFFTYKPLYIVADEEKNISYCKIRIRPAFIGTII